METPVSGAQYANSPATPQLLLMSDPGHHDTRDTSFAGEYREAHCILLTTHTVSLTEQDR